MPSTLLLRDRKGLHESTSAWDVACVMALCIQILISACFALNNIPQPCGSRADSVHSASKRSEARSTPDCCLKPRSYTIKYQSVTLPLFLYPLS